jgi:outer membrane protein assembly factor BamB
MIIPFVISMKNFFRKRKCGFLLRERSVAISFNVAVRFIAPLALLIIGSSSCFLFKSKVPPYPAGVIFPLEEAARTTYEGEITGYIQKKGGTLYFSTRKGLVCSLDGLKREILWKFQTQDILAMPPLLGQDNIYIFDRQYTIYCLDGKGNLLWEKGVGEEISTGLNENNGKLYFGTQKGNLFVLNSADAESVWSFKAGGAISSTPVVASGFIIFGSKDGYLYFFHDKVRPAGAFKVGAPVQIAPLVDGRHVYFGSEDSYVYCIDLILKTKKWKIKTGGKILTPPVTDTKRVFFLTSNNVLYCLKKTGGEVAWWEEIPSRSSYNIELVEDKIVVSSQSSVLVCFETIDGKKVGDFDLQQEVKSNPLWMAPYLLVNLYDFKKGEGTLVYLKKQVNALLSPNKASPQEPGEEINFTASFVGFFRPKYEFYIKEGEKKEVVQPESEKNTFTWFPPKEGSFTVGVKIRDERETATAEVPFDIKSTTPPVKQEIKK